MTVNNLFVIMDPFIISGNRISNIKYTATKTSPALTLIKELTTKSS